MTIDIGACIEAPDDLEGLKTVLNTMAMFAYVDPSDKDFQALFFLLGIANAKVYKIIDQKERT